MDVLKDCFTSDRTIQSDCSWPCRAHPVWCNNITPHRYRYVPPWSTTIWLNSSVGGKTVIQNISLGLSTTCRLLSLTYESRDAVIFAARIQYTTKYLSAEKQFKLIVRRRTFTKPWTSRIATEKRRQCATQHHNTNTVSKCRLKLTP